MNQPPPRRGCVHACAWLITVVILAACGAEAAVDEGSSICSISAPSTEATQAGSTTSAGVTVGRESIGSIGDLDLPVREAGPEFVIAVIHEFDGVTFVSPEGELVTAALPVAIGLISGGSFGSPRWIGDCTVEYAARVSSDIIQIVRASLDGSIEVAGPLDHALPYLVGLDGTGLFRSEIGWQVGKVGGSLVDVPVEAADLWPLAVSGDGTFLARLLEELVRINKSGAVEPFLLPDFGTAELEGEMRHVMPNAAAFGPRGLLALGLEDGRLVIVAQDSIVKVADLALPAFAVAWDQTGTALVVAVSGEPPPPPNAGWLVCDLLGDDGCSQVGPRLGRKDLTVIRGFTS